MNKEELIEALKNCNTGCEEANHLNADDLLLEYIDDDRVTEAFDDINKWYA